MFESCLSRVSWKKVRKHTEPPFQIFVQCKVTDILSEHVELIMLEFSLMAHFVSWEKGNHDYGWLLFHSFKGTVND